MTAEFDATCKLIVEKLELKIARGQNRQHMQQIPANSRAKVFKRNYRQRTKTSSSVVDVAKKATGGVWKISKHQLIDIAHKYGFKIPTERHPKKHLGSTGIIVLRRGPNKYFLVKRANI